MYTCFRRTFGATAMALSTRIAVESVCCRRSAESHACRGTAHVGMALLVLFMSCAQTVKVHKHDCATLCTLWLNVWVCPCNVGRLVHSCSIADIRM